MSDQNFRVTFRCADEHEHTVHLGGGISTPELAEEYLEHAAWPCLTADCKAAVTRTTEDLRPKAEGEP